MKWLRDPREFLNRVVHRRFALPALFGYAFLEGAILPIPIEAVIVPFMQLRRDILWLIPAIALAGFFASSILGFAIGALFYDQLGAPLIAWMGWQAQFHDVERFLAQWGFWAVMVLGFTPLPTQILMIGAGAFGVPPLSFIVAVLLARGTRNFGAGALVYYYGDRVVHWFQRRQNGGRPPPEPKVAAKPDQPPR